GPKIRVGSHRNPDRLPELIDFAQDKDNTLSGLLDPEATSSISSNFKHLNASLSPLSVSPDGGHDNEVQKCRLKDSQYSLAEMAISVGDWFGMMIFGAGNRVILV
ncbi:13530_t:CDS:2, partial [Racocetra fulgida]